MANSRDTAESRTPSYAAPADRPSSLTLPVVLAGVVLVAMSISGTAVALPSIGRDLDASGSPLNWVVAGYNLAFAAMTLIAGSTADRIGRRRVFVASALVFTAGFLGTALSPAIVVTDVTRVVSGAGGAGIMAAGGAILASSYDGAARNRAFALMGTMAGVGIAVGPTLSGLMVSAAGWRGSFAVFTVVGLLVAAGGTRARESRTAGAGRFDWAGGLLFVAALALLMFALLEAPALGWTHLVVLLTGIAGLVVLIAFGVVQRRGDAPVLAPALVANRGFLGWSLATLTTSIGFLGVLVFLPTYLQAAAGFLNTLRGAAEALVIAAYSASLAGLLASRLGDTGRAAEVGAGRLTEGAERVELDAFTWSWHVTQLGVGLLCLVLTVTVAVLIGGRAATSRST